MKAPSAELREAALLSDSVEAILFFPVEQQTGGFLGFHVSPRMFLFCRCLIFLPVF